MDETKEISLYRCERGVRTMVTATYGDIVGAWQYDYSSGSVEACESKLDTYFRTGSLTDCALGCGHCAVDLGDGGFYVCDADLFAGKRRKVVVL